MTSTRRPSADVSGTPQTDAMNATTIESYSCGDRVQVAWSGREGVVVALHRHRLASVRVLLDDEQQDWGFRRDELVKIRG